MKRKILTMFLACACSAVFFYSNPAFGMDWEQWRIPHDEQNNSVRYGERDGGAIIDFLPPPDFPLLEAVKKGDIKKVKSILKALEAYKSSQAFQDLKAKIAAQPGDAKYKKAFLRAALLGLNEDEINEKGRSGTPLSTAAMYGNLKIVKLLIEHGAEIDFGKEDGDRTPLIEASAQGHVKVVKYLILKGADVNGKSGGVTPLLEACKHYSSRFGPEGDKTKTIYVLLEKGADVNVQEDAQNEGWLNTGRTPLIDAVIDGDAAIVRALLAKGAKTDLKDKDGDTALSLAKKNGLEYISQLLEKSGSGKNESSQQEKPSLPPLSNAVEGGNHGKVKALIPEGEGFKAFSRDGYFSCEVPENWRLEKKADQERMGVFQIELIAPDAEKVPVTLYVSYFSKGNKYFKDYNDYVDSNSQDDMAAATDKYSPVTTKTLDKRKAFEFDREEKHYLHPESKSDESVILKEKFYVLPAKEGFFVMHFSAPKDIFLKHLPVLERVARTFKGLS